MAPNARRRMVLARAVMACILAASLVAVGALVSVPSMAFATLDGGQQNSTVKVGVVEQAGSAKRDDDGVLRGFDAEYMNRIAQYAGFTMEYTFYPDFDELLNAVERGEVQTAAGISKTPEREQRFLYAERKIGSGKLNLRVRPDDDRYEYGNVDQIAHMKVGAIEGSIMATKALEWAQEAAIELNLKTYAGESELTNALSSGEIDGAFVNSSVLADCREILVLDVIDYFVVFNKNERDLKNAVDSAMNRILNEDVLYFEHLEGAYKPKRAASLAFTAAEKHFLEEHSQAPLIVAAIADNPPYHDHVAGTTHGIVKDYYDHLAEVISEGGAPISFEVADYPNLDEAIEAVASGKADVLGMTIIDSTTAGQHGLALTCSYGMQNIISIAMPQNQNLLFENGTGVRTAVLESERDTLAVYLATQKTDYDLMPMKSLDDCYKALQTGAVEVFVTSSARATWLMNQHRAGTFVEAIVSESILPEYGAVASKNAELGAILSKASQADETALGTITVANTAPRVDTMTVFNRLPVPWLIAGFTAIVVALGASIYGVGRVIHERDMRRKNREIIDAQENLLWSYEHDAVTGLINRRGAIRRLKAALASSGPYSMVFVGIDNFHTINESYGHDMGDRVMVETGKRLLSFAQEIPDRRTVYRYGMGLFLLVCEEVLFTRDSNEVQEIARIAQTPLSLTDHAIMGDAKGDVPGTDALRLRASLGIATSSGSDDPEQVIRNCHMALDRAREGEERGIYAYSNELLQQMSHSNEVQELLEQAVEDELFYMVYQPQINLGTHTVGGYEALVRMKDGGVSPGEFIPLAESNGLILRIGRITTKLVVQQLAAWRDEGMELRPVSINYSSMQMADTGYIDYLFELLEEYRIDPSLIEIEITERLVMRHEKETSAFFGRLQQAGIKILMDDFGTGYSSLNYLAYIPVDVIKFDKSIVDAFLVCEVDAAEEGSDSRGNEFVRNLVRMSHGLGKTVIVEGVEELWQAELLTNLEADAIQGYCFSRPLPANEVPSYRVPVLE